MPDQGATSRPPRPSCTSLPSRRSPVPR